jgi:hypothetical protein
MSRDTHKPRELESLQVRRERLLAEGREAMRDYRLREMAIRERTEQLRAERLKRAAAKG